MKNRAAGRPPWGGGEASPGFVDLQVNGYLGADFSAPGLTFEAIAEVVRELRVRGTLAFCPTLITSAPEVYEHNLPVLARACQDPELGPHLLGIHLEGPFISPLPGARGAHSPQAARMPDRTFLDRLLELAEGRVVLVTLAPELPGAPALIRYITSLGVRVSLGHHLAAAGEIASACDAGAVAVTHLGNGIPNQLPRHPNPLWDQLAEDRLSLMVIPDGHHIPPSFLKVVLRARPTRRIIAVSDAAPVAGLPPGEYLTLGQSVRLEPDGRLWNPEGNHLTGSSSSLLECMNYLAGLGLLKAQALWQVGMINPLNLLGFSIDRLSGLKGAKVRFSRGRFQLD